jgi:renal tumor antigen
MILNILPEYKLISKKGEGTFSEVVKAQVIKTSKFVAIKRMKNTFETIEQVNSLREIQALKKLSPHPGVIKLSEVL